MVNLWIGELGIGRVCVSGTLFGPHKYLRHGYTGHHRDHLLGAAVVLGLKQHLGGLRPPYAP